MSSLYRWEQPYLIEELPAWKKEEEVECFALCDRKIILHTVYDGKGPWPIIHSTGVHTDGTIHRSDGSVGEPPWKVVRTPSKRVPWYKKILETVR